jgi:hypothetical protein
MEPKSAWGRRYALSAPGNSQLIRVHGAFVDEKEIGKVVEHIKAQGKPNTTRQSPKPKKRWTMPTICQAAAIRYLSKRCEPSFRPSVHRPRFSTPSRLRTSRRDPRRYGREVIGEMEGSTQTGLSSKKPTKSSGSGRNDV